MCRVLVLSHWLVGPRGVLSTRLFSCSACVNARPGLRRASRTSLPAWLPRLPKLSELYLETLEDWQDHYTLAATQRPLLRDLLCSLLVDREKQVLITLSSAVTLFRGLQIHFLA